jgi:hypothetical protein
MRRRQSSSQPLSIAFAVRCLLVFFGLGVLGTAAWPVGVLMIVIGIRGW